MSFIPEWSPVAAVVIVWPQPSGDWAANFNEVEACYWELLKALADCSPVWLLRHPQMKNDEFIEQVNAIDAMHSIEVIDDIAYDDTWVRDFGPLSVEGGLLSFTFNGWGGKYSADNDNGVARALASKKGLQLVEQSFVCEGGALEVNDTGILLANAECVVDQNRNPGLNREGVESALKNILGIKDVAWLEGICVTGDDTDGHVDTIARFAPGDRVVYSGRNADHHDSVVLESLHQQISELANKYQWQLYELPTPILNSAVDGRLLPATYANFLIVNGAVLVPVYDCEEDQAALAILQEAFPSHKLTPVKCSALAEQHGSLHCSTMQIAQSAIAKV